MDTKASMDIVAAGNVAIASFRSTCVSNVDEIRNASTQIREYVEKNRPKEMVFDFSGVGFFSSQVLGLLLEVRAWLRERGGQVVVCALSSQLQRVFRITNLDRIFTFFPDRETAIRESAACS
jgi:anti-sigma B factor antagonist